MCDHRSNHMIEANLDLRLKIQRSMQTWCFGASLERMSATAKMNPLLRVHLFGNWKHGLAQRKSPCLRSARSMWLTCFSLIRIDPAIPQSVAFVGWIFACWLCGHVFKCCKHVAMHFIVNVENLIQVMALMRSFSHLSPFCMSGVCWRYPHRNRAGQCEIPHNPRVPWRISVYQDESGGVCPQQSASGDISRV